jgi:hypothetical protein
MKKFEKFTVVTCMETYSDGKTAVSALDALVPAIIEGVDSEVTLIDIEVEGEYELVKKAEKEVTA